jgi:hypothetical protein
VCPRNQRSDRQRAHPGERAGSILVPERTTLRRPPVERDQRTSLRDRDPDLLPHPALERLEPGEPMQAKIHDATELRPEPRVDPPELANPEPHLLIEIERVEAVEGLRWSFLGRGRSRIARARASGRT